MRAGSLFAVALLAVVFVAGVVTPVAGTGSAAVPDAASAVETGSDSVLASGPADTGDVHGNHVAVDPQVSADGTVVAETVATLASGFLVLKADDDGRPGEPVGHTYLDGVGFRTDVSVALDAAAGTDHRRLWAVVHFDDGDGEFDPAADPSGADRNPAARQSFALGDGDRPVHVLARESDPLATDEGALTVRRVSLARDGYLVAHPIDGDRVVGRQSLSAGRHDGVRLALDESFLDASDSRFRVRLVAYRDDGDGEFDADDSPVRVGDAVVGTDVVVDRERDPAATDDGPSILTPTPTPASGETVTAGTDATEGTAPDGTDSTDATGPGFGVAATALAVVVALAGLALSGRRRP